MEPEELDPLAIPEDDLEDDDLIPKKPKLDDDVESLEDLAEEEEEEMDEEELGVDYE